MPADVFEAVAEAEAHVGAALALAGEAVALVQKAEAVLKAALAAGDRKRAEADLDAQRTEAAQFEAGLSLRSSDGK